MARALFFNKRVGGVFWRCGCCGEDQELTKPVDTARGLCGRVRDTDRLELVAPGALPLLLGNTLVALVCAGCSRAVLGDLARLAPRSLVDTDLQANLLGDC
jgi:hypothetical protein